MRQIIGKTSDPNCDPNFDPRYGGNNKFTPTDNKDTVVNPNVTVQGPKEITLDDTSPFVTTTDTGKAHTDNSNAIN